MTQVSKKIGEMVQLFFDKIFDAILFFKRNIIIIVILFILGVGLGFYKDKTTKVYNHEIIVIPNFNSVDYLYSKVKLIDSKIREQDQSFLDKIGLKDSDKMIKIDVEPIIDVYKLINKNEENLEMIKLLSEDGSTAKILEDNITSKNYKYHLITFSTVEATDVNKTVQPILDYLNKNDYYKKIQKERLGGIALKVKTNEETIGQINSILNQFSGFIGANQKSDKLIYYNENMQLNDIIKTKDQLTQELGGLKEEFQNSDKIIKDNSTILNIKNVKSLNGKFKLVLPILFIGIFIAINIFMSFYKKQMTKRNLA